MRVSSRVLVSALGLTLSLPACGGGTQSSLPATPSNANTQSMVRAVTATTPPVIKDVVVSGTTGSYTITMTGGRFGNAPSDVPCTACTPLELQVVDLARSGVGLPVNVTAWTNNSITVTGIGATKGDPLEVSIYNGTAGNAALWGGNAGWTKGLPTIASVTMTGTGASMVVTVTGKGFGATAPAAVGTTGTSPFFMFSDINGTTSGFNGDRWNGGFCGALECDGVSMVYTSWSDTQVVMSGFGGGYGSNNWFNTANDAVCVAVWPSSSTSNGTTGAAVKCKRSPL